MAVCPHCNDAAARDLGAEIANLRNELRATQAERDRANKTIDRLAEKLSENAFR